MILLIWKALKETSGDWGHTMFAKITKLDSMLLP